MCPYCGNANPDTRRECQYCGAPLSETRRSEYGSGGQPMQPAQPQQSVQPTQSTQAQASELPAWLQSLRSDAPVRSSEPSNFSAADFMEESDLPRWMQPNSGPDEEPDEEQYGSQGMQGMQGTGSLRPSSFPGPTTDEGYVRNISAHDLIDEQMLPDWMKSNGGGASNAPLEGQRHISASGLIQQDSVPDWMRNFPQEQPGTPQSAPSYQEHVPQAFNVSTPSSFSAHELIDQQALPSWLREQSGQGNQGSQESQQRQQMGSNPNWNAAQQQQASEPARHVAASSFIDMNSLPSWMSEASKSNMPDMPVSSQQPGQQQYSASPQMPGQAMWQNMPSQQQTPSQQSGLSAASFIDVNSLPDWLRASSEMGQSAMQQAPTSSAQSMNGAYGVQGQAGQQGQQGQQGQGYGIYGTYGAQQRAENVRVPSRPRGDIGMNEGNEAAANAFSSVLGVASHTPQFSQGTPYTAQQTQQPSPTYPAQPTYPASPASPMSSTRPSSQQYPNDAFAVQSPLNMGQGQQPTYMNNIGVAQVPPMGAQSMQNAMPYNQMQYQQNQMQGQQVQQRSGQPNQSNQEKAQKRGGLFEAIRNFFFRQS